MGGSDKGVFCSREKRFCGRINGVGMQIVFCGQLENVRPAVDLRRKEFNKISEGEIEKKNRSFMAG